jgi:hypothetical protein
MVIKILKAIEFSTAVMLNASNYENHLTQL